MHTCCTLLWQIHSSLPCTNSWAVWSPRGVRYLRSRLQQRIGYGSSLQWYIPKIYHNTYGPTDAKQVDEEEEGGLRGLTEVLLSYGEHHFDAANQGTWASVLLMCGQFERVRHSQHHGLSYALTPFHVGCFCTVGASGNRD